MLMAGLREARLLRQCFIGSAGANLRNFFQIVEWNQWVPKVT
jgi:hypothetical protein